MPNKTELKSLLHRYHAYQQLIVEGCADHSLEAFTKWSEFCVVTTTTFTSRYIKIELPSRSNGLPVAHYVNHEIKTGLWLACSDIGTDTEVYRWCRNRVTAWLREMLFRLTAEGPYLTHIIKLGGD